MEIQPNQTAETICGTIERCVFHNAQTGFAVLIVAVQDLGNITATGTFSNVAPGQDLQLTGTWRQHKKFGKQFEVSSSNLVLPTSDTGLKKYLGSGLIKGIGKAYAEKLVDRFGSAILTIIDEQPSRLAEIPGIGPKRIEQITTAWKDQKAISSIMIFLQDKGISTAYAIKIYKHYKERAMAVLNENPYRLADEIWGIGFKTADLIAQKIGIDIRAPQRVRAGTLFCLSQVTKQGSLYSKLEQLKENTRELLAIAPEDDRLIEHALNELHKTDKIISLIEDDTTYIALASYHRAEVGLAQYIKTLLSIPSPYALPLETIEQKLKQLTSNGLQLNEQQIQGIISSLQNKVSIITGGPGTGKTTLIQQLLTILDHHKISYRLAAPTGRAAQRISESSQRQATTIHRLLEFDKNSMSFKHHEQNPLDLDFLIIDEASMVDIFLAHALIKAVPIRAHVLLLGDIHQLPSVGPGNVLNDLIASGIIPTTRLTTIFRQAQGSLIITNAHRIKEGEFPRFGGPQEDFILIKEDDPEKCSTHIRRIVTQELSRRLLRINDLMVLCPMNKGACGTQALNVFLQELFNPHAHDRLVYLGTNYCINDKVMQIRNNYDKMVFNGDIGILHSIDHEDQVFTVNFDGRLISYDFDEINELVLAYAITIHKSQGSEYPVVIVPFFTQHFTLLQRNLMYTAVTRAKKLCIFIGQIKAIAIAVKNQKNSERLTFLKKFLER